MNCKELRQFFGLPARRAVDDGASGHIRRQAVHQDLVDVRELLSSGRRHHHKLQIIATGAAIEDLQFNTEFVPEVQLDVFHHVGLGCRGQAQHGRAWLLPRVFADKASHVAIIGPKVVSPLREAMGLVQHPGTDLALIQHPAHGSVAELFRRDDEDTRVPEPDPIQRIGSLRQGQQPVDSDARADAMRLQTRHLVRHKRDQGRDHHRQGTRLVVAGQGWDLVAERLAGTGGQNPQNVPPGHCRLDDGLLHGPAVLVRRLRTEVGKAKPTFKLLAGVVSLLAPIAGGIAAGGVPQPVNQLSRLRELVAYPGWHDRVAPGYRQPRQRIGQRPTMAGRVCQDLAPVCQTGVAL